MSKTFTSRFNHKGAVTVLDVLNSAQPLLDEHPNIDYKFEKRNAKDPNFSNPGNLTNLTDKLNLQLYWLEFLGDGVIARTDEVFLAKKITNMMGRLGGYWEKRILAQFDVEWTKRSATGNPQNYENWLNDIRKQANDFCKKSYIKCQTPELGRDKRIKALKKIYKGDWKDHIWRILDIDDIGSFFDEYNPVYKKHEKEVKEATNHYKGGFGVFPSSRW